MEGSWATHVADKWRELRMVLYWHFKQAVLANLRGTGEPVFDHNYSQVGVCVVRNS